MLDTQMQFNSIAGHVVDEYHLDTEEYYGDPIEGIVDGVTTMPIGQLNITFSFLDGGTGKRYTAQFLVLAKADFDIAIGGPFIRESKIYIKDPRGYIGTLQQIKS